MLVTTFALGIGKAAGESERALALVRAYISARQQGNGSLARSMLSREQQRELVAIQGHDYAHAQLQLCPEYILRDDSGSHLQNPALPEMAAGPLLAQYSPLGAAVVRSGYTNMELIAVPEHGQLKLDMRGIEKLDFVRECSQSGKLSAQGCVCTFNLLRVQGLVSERGVTEAILDAISRDALRCRSQPSLTS